MGENFNELLRSLLQGIKRKYDPKNPATSYAKLTPPSGIKNMNYCVRVLGGCFFLIIFLFFSSFITNAGEYHATSEETYSGTETLACSQCHTMHGSQGGTDSLFYVGGGPNLKLLRASSILNLCLFCHGDTNPGPVEWDSRTPPQIVDNKQGPAAASYVPSGGDFMDRTVVNEANRHSLDKDVSAAIDEPPGYNGTWSDVVTRYSPKFNCLYCHDQHGNSNFRNLRYDPGTPENDNRNDPDRVVITFAYDPVSDPDDNTKDVNYWGPGADTPVGNKFTRTNVRFRRAPLDTDLPVRGISAFCGKCHMDFWGESGDANVGGSISGGLGAGDDNSASDSPWVRHPVDDISIGLANSNLHADLSNWSGIAATAKARHIDPTDTGDFGEDQPFCLSCHYAHGGGNPNFAGVSEYDHSNLAMKDSTGLVNIDPSYDTASGRIRNVCQQCHNQ